MHINSKTKLLEKSYNKSIKSLNKKFFSIKNTGLFLFVEYLKYIRDSMILDDEVSQNSLATIITAIAEFEAYDSCRNKTNKSFHWINFCELVKENMEEWILENDSV